MMNPLLQQLIESNYNNNNNEILVPSLNDNINNNIRLLEDEEAIVTTSDNDDDDDGRDTKEWINAILSNIFLFLLIFGLSGTVDCKNLQKQLTNKFAICTGVAMQFLIMPILGFLSVTIFKSIDGNYFTEAMGITLLVVTASPGGSYSNWWCSTFNADLALSVAMTTVSSLLSIGLLPLNLFLYTYLSYGNAKNEFGESVIEALDFSTIFITLGIVLSAIGLGLAAGYKYDTHKFHITCNRMGSIAGIMLILFSAFLSSGADGAESKAWNQHWSFYIAVAFPCLLGIALSNIIARSVNLSPPEIVAISIECCYQNTGIATSVAITMFSNKEDRAQAVAVPLFYGVIEAIVIGIYCVYAWKIGWTKAPANEKLCVVISKTYEVDDEDENNEPQETDDAIIREDGSNHRNDDCGDLENGVCAQEVVPAPRKSFFQRLFGTSKNNVPTTIPTTDIDNDKHVAAVEESPKTDNDDKNKSAERQRIRLDTMETALTSDSAHTTPRHQHSSSPSNSSSQTDLVASAQTATIPEVDCSESSVEDFARCENSSSQQRLEDRFNDEVTPSSHQQQE